jgi:hypothetical protein
MWAVIFGGICTHFCRELSAMVTFLHATRVNPGPFFEGFLTEFLHLDVTRGILPPALSKVLEGYFVSFPPVRQDGIYGDVRVKEFFKFQVFCMYQTHDVTWVLHRSENGIVDWLGSINGIDEMARLMRSFARAWCEDLKNG